MSGICGIFNLDGSPVDQTVLSRMASAAVHRGPDGINFFTDGPVGLGHLALQVTPESKREKQPLVYGRGDYVLTADARIDNREELIPELTEKGFLTQGIPTDSDLIMAAYLCWASSSPEHLLGDFAFALWDRSNNCLFAARDSMAMRAFYYRIEPRRAVFATEVKQILTVPEVPSVIFEPAVGAHLAYMPGSLEWTFYKGIAQLPPGYALYVDAEGHRKWRYWQIDPHLTITYRTEQEYIEHFLEIFKDAVRCRLRSIYPVGILLSGGLDSGSIASTAGWLAQKGDLDSSSGLHAYCFAFQEQSECDEHHISEGITTHFGFPVTDVLADDARPLSNYPLHGPDRDSPLVGTLQSIVEYALKLAGGEGVRIILSGDHGDNMIDGAITDYPGLLKVGQWFRLFSEIKAHSRWPGNSLKSVLNHHVLRPFLYWLWPHDRFQRLRRSLHLIIAPRKLDLPPWINPEFARRIGLADFAEEHVPLLPVRNFARYQRFKHAFDFYGTKYTTLAEQTRARYGLAFADPWSDARLARFVMAIPQFVLERVGESKRLVRLAMKGIMPEQVRWRATKIIPESFYQDTIRNKAKDVVSELITGTRSGANGYISEDRLQDHYRSILRGRQSGFPFWQALTLEMWLRKYWE